MHSVRLKKTFKKVVDSGGKISVGRAMIESGYSEKTAKSPIKVTESKSWKELLEQYLPDEKLAKVANQGLEATKKEDKERVPDHYIRHRYLETSLKLKGKLLEGYEDGKGNININVIQFGYVPGPVETATTSTGSNEGHSEIQDADLAQEGTEDNNSTDGTNPTGNAV